MNKEKNPVQEYLMQIAWHEARIEDLLEERASWQSRRERITSAWGVERVSGTPNPDKICDITEKIFEIERRLDAAIDECIAKKEEIHAVIKQVRDTNQFKVLSKVYVHGKSLEQAACEIGYSYRQTCNIHGRALQAVAAVMESEDKENA